MDVGSQLLLLLLGIEEWVRESLTRQGRGKRKEMPNNYIEIYSNRAFIYGYYSNFAYIQYFRQTDVCSLLNKNV